MGLWDRVQDKRQQKKLDSKQNDEIKKLREQVERSEKRGEERERQMMMRGPRDDFGANVQSSAALIQRQYDQGYGVLGQRFARGDSKWLPQSGGGLGRRLTGSSNHREPTPSPSHRSATERDNCAPRCTSKRPPAHPGRYGEINRSL
jgi:hypothetical protein